MLKLSSLNFSIKKENIINNINISISNGKILTFLGPSGSGKTTILRLISGLLSPTRGTIILNNKIVADKNIFVPPEKRKIGLMFQENVLFPHLTVRENIAYGIKKKSKNLADNHTKLILEKFEISHFSNHYPEMLSGGEQQRVSLARALAANPTIMLLDEPFSSLDSYLRKDICDFTMDSLKNKNITTVMVTHDAEEALRVSDEIAILDRGRIKQLGKPKEIYFKPSNLISARILGPTTEILCKLEENRVKLPFFESKKLFVRNGDKVSVVIRPEGFRIDSNGKRAKIVDVQFLGKNILLKLYLNDRLPLLKMYSSEKNHKVGDKIKVSVDPKAVAVLTS